MAQYIEVAEARGRSGLRLALSIGVPGPWGESAKGILHVKGIDYAKVAQYPTMANEELVAWTGHANAPVAVYDDEPPRTGWAEILMLAERIEPSPSLLPAGETDRATVFGLAHEICGEMGFGWCRRLGMVGTLLDPALPLDDKARQPARVLGERYGYSADAAAVASARVAAITAMLAERLTAQRERGSRYLVGDALTAADVYWACFAALVRPLPPEQCPMPEMMRPLYDDPSNEFDEVLFEHRDFVYAEHLELPMDF